MKKQHKQSYEFKAILDKAPEGSLMSTIIIVPEDIWEQLPDNGRVRTKGSINSQTEFALAIQSFKTGERYLSISADLRKKAGIKTQDTLLVSFQIVDRDIVDIPEEFEAALEQDEEGKTLFYGFTKGLQRSLIHYISSAKSLDTRIKRSLEMIEKIKKRQLQIQQKKSK